MKSISHALVGMILAGCYFWPQAAFAQTCNTYRLGYEKAIAQGIIKRAPLVNGPRDAYAHFQTALRNGDRIEVAIRASQYLVIVSESSSLKIADIERRDLEDRIVKHYQKPVEVAVPMLAVILPLNAFCPLS